jgi:hypothetical protein
MKAVGLGPSPWSFVTLAGQAAGLRVSDLVAEWAWVWAGALPVLLVETPKIAVVALREAPRSSIVTEVEFSSRLAVTVQVIRHQAL